MFNKASTQTQQSLKKGHGSQGTRKEGRSSKNPFVEQKGFLFTKVGLVGTKGGLQQNERDTAKTVTSEPSLS